MSLFLKEHKRFLLLLVRHEVQFLLIGGYAVIYHGYERTTNDMDVWLKPDNKNRDQFINALKEHGVITENINRLKKMDFTEPQVLSIGKKPNQIEFLTTVAGLVYNEAAKNKETIVLENQRISLLSYEDLITNKMIIGRTQDKADVEVLQKIHRSKNND